MDSILSVILPFIAKYPSVGTLIFVVGALRAVLKPIMVVLHTYVAYTPNLADDAALAGVEDSTVYKWVAFALDYVASIKLPGAPGTVTVVQTLPPQV